MSFARTAPSSLCFPPGLTHSQVTLPSTLRLPRFSRCGSLGATGTANAVSVSLARLIARSDLSPSCPPSSVQHRRWRSASLAHRRARRRNCAQPNQSGRRYFRHDLRELAEARFDLLCSLCRLHVRRRFLRPQDGLTSRRRGSAEKPIWHVIQPLPINLDGDGRQRRAIQETSSPRRLGEDAGIELDGRWVVVSSRPAWHPSR